MRLYSIYIINELDQDTAALLCNGGWQERFDGHGYASKPFIGVSDDHSKELARTDIKFLLDGRDPDFTLVARNMVDTTIYKYRLVLPDGKKRSYKYEASARWTYRRLGGQLFRAVDRETVWEPYHV